MSSRSRPAPGSPRWEAGRDDAAVLEGICSGKHDLSLSREGMGRSMATIDVRNAETAKVA